MRLNRVLQVTAAISVAMAATIFTISCSDGEAGKDGSSCTIAQSAIGYDVLCGGAKVGELPNSAAVSQGDQGAPGANGKNGDNCVLGSKNGGAYQIVCGGQVKGSLDGCSASIAEEFSASDTTVSRVGGIVSINCGSTAVDFCDAGFSGSTIPAPANSVTGGTQKVFDSATEECVYLNKASGVVIRPLNPKCTKDTSVTYDATSQYCGYADTTNFRTGTVTALYLCGKEKLNDENSSEWSDKYCRVAVTRDPLTGKTTTEKTLSSAEDCDGTSIYPNKFDVVLGTGGWNSEYCGWSSASALSRTKINTNMCDDGKGAHEEAYYAGYCQVTTDAAAAYYTPSVTYSGLPATVRVSGQDAFCGTGARTSASSRVNEDTWQDEYCGYDLTASSLANVVKKKLKVLQATYGGLSASSLTKVQCAVLAPNAEKPEYDEEAATDALKLASMKKNAQYCAVDADKVVSLAKPSDNDCAAVEKLNEGAWLGQYCGYATATATTKTRINASITFSSPTSARDIKCGGLKPNTELPEGSTSNEKADNFQYCTVGPDGVMSLAKPSDNACTGNAIKLNEKVFNGDYCGYATATAVNITKITPSVTAGGAACGALAPNTEKPEGDTDNAKRDNFQYCQTNKDGKMVLAKPSDNTCVAVGTKLNEGSVFKGEYCGYSSTSTSAVISKITPTAAQGGAPCGILAPNSKSKPETANEMEYCTVDILGQMSLTSERCENSKTINEGEYRGQFCISGIGSLTNTGNPNGEKLVTCKEGKIGNYLLEPGASPWPTNIEECVWPDEG